MILHICIVSYSTILETGTAYLDPGSGSFILQLILASIMGALFMLGVYWKKVKQFLKGFLSKEDEDEDFD
jgi:hypothetical protein